MVDAAENYRTLLRPSMMAASKIWLTKSGYDSPEYGNKGEFVCWLLQGWLFLVSGLGRSSSFSYFGGPGSP